MLEQSVLKACAGAFCCREFWLCLSMPGLGAAHHLNHLGLTSACMALQLRPRAAGRDARCARARGGSTRSLPLLLPAPRGPACEEVVVILRGCWRLVLPHEAEDHRSQCWGPHATGDLCMGA